MAQLPYLDFQGVYALDHILVHDCLVTISKGKRFLVSGYYNAEYATNFGLKNVAPGYDWKGELIVVALGDRVPFLKRISDKDAFEAINKSVANILF